MKTLSVTRKNDRIAMGKIIVALADKFTMKSDITVGPDFVMATITADDGTRVSVEFCKKYNFVLAHWNVGLLSDSQFSKKFESVVGSVNQYHRRKATSCTHYGVYTIRDEIERGLQVIADGAAYL